MVLISWLNLHQIDQKNVHLEVVLSVGQLKMACTIVHTFVTIWKELPF